jgi:BED zinc finger
MAPRGRKTGNRDWLTDPNGEVPPILSSLYTKEHFLWKLLEVPSDSNKPRICVITCTHCGNFNNKVPAAMYNNTSNALTHLRNKHPEIAKEIENKSKKETL